MATILVELWTVGFWRYLETLLHRNHYRFVGDEDDLGES